MTTMIWLLTLTFLIMLTMGISYSHAYGEQKKRYQRLDAQYRKLNERYELYRSASYHLVKAMPPEHLVKEDDAQAVQDYHGLAEQYRAMIDELYDFGEQIAQRHRQHGQENTTTREVQERGQL